MQTETDGTELWAKPASVQSTRQNGVVGEARGVQSTRQNGVFGRSPRVHRAPARYRAKPSRIARAKALQDSIDFLPISEKTRELIAHENRTMTKTECRYTNTDTTTRPTKHESLEIVTESQAMFRGKPSHIGPQHCHKKTRRLIETTRVELTLRQ